MARTPSILYEYYHALLKPITLVAVVMATINSFTVFTQIYVMTQGCKGRRVMSFVLVYDIYEKGFRFYQMGLASAEAVVLFVLVFFIMLVQIKAMRAKQEGGESIENKEGHI